MSTDAHNLLHMNENWKIRLWLSYFEGLCGSAGKLFRGFYANKFNDAYETEKSPLLWHSKVQCISRF